MGKCNSPLKQPVRNTWPLVYAVSSHTDRVGRPSARGLVHQLSSAEWSDTRRRIGGSFTRTSQAFARFNPEIRTGVAELVEHSARRPRPRVRRVVVNLSPHRTQPRSRSPANRRTPARHRGCGDSWLPLGAGSLGSVAQKAFVCACLGPRWGGRRVERDRGHP